MIIIIMFSLQVGINTGSDQHFYTVLSSTTTDTTAIADTLVTSGTWSFRIDQLDVVVGNNSIEGRY